MVSNINSISLNIYQLYKIIYMLEDNELMIETANNLMEILGYDDRFEYNESTGHYRKSN